MYSANNLIYIAKSAIYAFCTKIVNFFDAVRWILCNGSYEKCNASAHCGRNIAFSVFVTRSVGKDLIIDRFFKIRQHTKRCINGNGFAALVYISVNIFPAETIG